MPSGQETEWVYSKPAHPWTQTGALFHMGWAVGSLCRPKDSGHIMGPSATLHPPRKFPATTGYWTVTAGISSHHQN